MIFLIDQNLPPALAGWLREKGLEALHVREIGLRDKADAEIVTVAAQNGYTVITKDDDFAFHGQPPVILVRIGNVTNPRLLTAFERAWPGIQAALQSGETLVELH